MGVLNGKIAVVTGAGRGIGREICLSFAKEGAKVVVNDLGGDRDGTGGGKVADEVVKEIKDLGGEASANYDTVGTVQGGQGIFQTCIDSFGAMDILVNNAGILRDKTLYNMEESEWMTSGGDTIYKHKESDVSTGTKSENNNNKETSPSNCGSGYYWSKKHGKCSSYNP